MAALDFPPGTTTGQTFTAGNGVTYVWNGTVWLASGASAGGDFSAVTGSAVNLTTTPTAIVFNTVKSGNSGSWLNTSTGRFTPPAGRYYISAFMTFDQAGATPASAALILRKNSVDQTTTNTTLNGAGHVEMITVDGTYDASGTDFFDIFASATANSILAYRAGTTSFTAYPISGIKGPPGDPAAGIDQNAQTASYTLVLGDAGRHIYHAVAAAAATYTIPANASVAFPIGTTLTFVNDSANAVTIAITTDTMVWSPGVTTGSRTLAVGGMATALKVTDTRWLINGTGLT